MKHIVVLDTGKEWGGGINSLLALLSRIDREQFRFTVLLYRDLPRGESSTLKSELAALGIETIIVPQSTRTAAVRLRRALLKAVSVGNAKLRQRLLFRAERRSRIEPDARRIAALLRQLHADLLYLNNQPSSNMEGYLAAGIAGVPVVQHCRKVTLLNPDEVATANRYLDRMICVSAGLQDEYLRQGIDPERSLVVANGIDLTSAPTLDPATVRARFGIGRDELVVGTIASFLGVKRLPDLLEAFAVLVQRHPNSRCLMVGDGPLRSMLEQRAAELGIGDRVIFTGFQREPLNYLAAMDIFALTSEREGMPRVVLEAMLLGKPVVGSRVTGIADLVAEGETGLLFPAGAVAECAAALAALGGDPALRQTMGEAGAALVRRDYSIHSYVQGVERTFSQVLAAPGQATAVGSGGTV